VYELIPTAEVAGVGEGGCEYGRSGVSGGPLSDERTVPRRIVGMDDRRSKMSLFPNRAEYNRRKFLPTMPPRRGPKTAPRPKETPNKRKPLTKTELRGLEDDIKAKFQWEHTVKAHQLEGIIGQLQMRDVLVHAGTGSGKTAIAAGPHAHKSSEGKVTLMISPLIALHDEQVRHCTLQLGAATNEMHQVDTFREEFKLKAIAVNSSNGGCKIEVLKVRLLYLILRTLH
jgi:hypothetical protein